MFSLSGNIFSLTISDPEAVLYLNGDDFELGEVRELKDKDW